MSASVRRLAKKIALEDRIPTLGPNEERPEHFYTTNHFTGGSASVARVRHTKSEPDKWRKP